VSAIFERCCREAAVDAIRRAPTRTVDDLLALVKAVEVLIADANAAHPTLILSPVVDALTDAIFKLENVQEITPEMRSQWARDEKVDEWIKDRKEAA
jgi:hypothetical protein